MQSWWLNKFCVPLFWNEKIEAIIEIINLLSLIRTYDFYYQVLTHGKMSSNLN